MIEKRAMGTSFEVGVGSGYCPTKSAGVGHWIDRPIEKMRRWHLVWWEKMQGVWGGSRQVVEKRDGWKWVEMVESWCLPWRRRMAEGVWRREKRKRRWWPWLYRDVEEEEEWKWIVGEEDFRTLTMIHGEERWLWRRRVAPLSTTRLSSPVANPIPTHGSRCSSTNYNTLNFYYGQFLPRGPTFIWVYKYL